MLKENYKPKVTEEKKKIVSELVDLINKNKVLGIVDLYKLPSAQYQKIKNSLKGKASIKVVKKSLLERALENSNKKELIKYIPLHPALLISNENPFKLYLFIEKNKSSAPARTGDIATNDIIVPAGPTDIPPGPAISTLQKVKIPTKVEAGKISIIKDTIVCKAGEKISQDLVSALNLLKLEPMQIGLNVKAIYEDGILYTKEILSVDEQKIISDFSSAVLSAINFSVNISWPEKQTINILLTKAYLNAKNLGIEACILEKNIIESILQKANANAFVISKKLSL
ncbi:MAG: 50S ribosomal protein L10 [Candidatus Aenigmatarchaeota archaeon]|nr:50S ribosomal protein L10 [Candidatus Aenigmarchaeota archaeon]